MQERTRDTAADKYFVVSRILLHPTTSLRLVKCGDKRRVKYGDQHNYLSDIFIQPNTFLPHCFNCVGCPRNHGDME